MGESLVISFIHLARGLLGDVTFDLDTHGFETSDVSKVVTP